MPPTVSVIVPNYNHAPYLKQRLDSIFNQTFQDFEVIILDDCSTDNSKDVIEGYRNRPQVSHIVYNETNSGSPFKQWAKGFDLAQGEYIWIAESDDWSESVFLETLTTILNNNQSLILAYSESKWEYNDKTEIKSLFPKSSLLNGISLIKSHFCWNNAIYNASSVLFRRNALKRISNEYQNYFGSGDYLFWIFLCEQGNVYFESQALNHFRQHGDSTTTLNRKSGNIYLENLRIHDYLQKKGYMSFFRKHSSIASYLQQIDQDLSTCTQNITFVEAKKAWSKKTFSSNFSYVVSFLGTGLWNLLNKIHL